MINGTKVICLCGSTRFTSEMLLKKWELTKQGNVVFGWCVFPAVENDIFVSHMAEKEGCQEVLDRVHKLKIDMSDRVHIMNIDGYIGESTNAELNHAIAWGKEVTFEEPVPAGSVPL